VALFWRETILPYYDDDDDGDDDDDDDENDESAMRKDGRETRDTTVCGRKEIHRGVANKLAQPVTAIKKNDVASLLDEYQEHEEKTADKASIIPRCRYCFRKLSQRDV